MLETTFFATNSIFSSDIDLICFDVTTLYFESLSVDDLKSFGFSKDAKFNNVQVTLALATTKEGLPVGYKLFPGNTAESKTLIACILEWKRILPIKEVIFVGDRAMFSGDNLHEIIKNGYKFIIAMPLRKLNETIKSKVLDGKYYKLSQISEGSEIYWNSSFEYAHQIKILKEESVTKKRRAFQKIDINGKIVASYNTKRALKDQKNRERILKKIEKQVTKGNDIGSVKSAVTNAGLKKYLKISTEQKVMLDKSKVELDSKWDGMHGLFTNTNLEPQEVMSKYRHLLLIEDCFRVSKSDLEMRPIYHYKPLRIRGHVALCYLSLCLIRYAQQKLKRAELILSPRRLNEELSSIQYSIIQDKSNNKTYKMPSCISTTGKLIYKAIHHPYSSATIAI